MCGRYLLKEIEAIDKVVREVFGFGLNLERPRYNVAPSQLVPTVAADEDGTPRPTQMRWGLVPFWERTEKPKLAPINARAEDALTKPMFRQALQRRRCVIPADGFYEWKRINPETKVPHLIQRTKGRPFFFAGIFEPATPTRPETCLLFTTRPNELMAGIYDRMPVILDDAFAKAWLQPGAMRAEELATFASPFPADQMQARRVSRLVNNVRNDGPEILTTEEELLIQDDLFS